MYLGVFCHLLIMVSSDPPPPLWWQPWSTRRHMSWFGNSYPWRFCLSPTTGFFYRTKSSDEKKHFTTWFCVFRVGWNIYLCCFFLGTQGVVFSGISRDPLSFVLMVHTRLMGRHCHTGCNNHAISTGPVLFYMQVSELGVFHIAQVLTFLHCFLEWSSTICSGSTYNPCGTIWDCPRITTSAFLTYP